MRTGCFLVMNLGEKNLNSSHGLISTLACDQDGKRFTLLKEVFLLAAPLFNGYAIVCGFLTRPRVRKYGGQRRKGRRSLLCTSLCWPWCSVLGAECPGCCFGLTRDTTPTQITRAALKSIALQSYDEAWKRIMTLKFHHYALMVGQRKIII